jgi:hypothetical protein
LPILSLPTRSIGQRPKRSLLCWKRCRNIR